MTKGRERPTIADARAAIQAAIAELKQAGVRIPAPLLRALMLLRSCRGKPKLGEVEQ
jgi:hypothetical protein